MKTTQVLAAALLAGLSLTACSEPPAPPAPPAPPSPPVAANESPKNFIGRHVDKETGVGPWFEPFEVKYEFVYTGTGKKGGY